MNTALTIPMERYSRDDVGAPVPTLNSGTAHRLLTRSALHAWYNHPRLNPEWVEVRSESFDIGSAAHAILLEGRAELLAICDVADDWRTAAARKFRDEAREAGRIPMLAADAERVVAIVESAKRAMVRCPDLDNIGDLDAEQTFVWQDPITGAWLRCRPDWVSTDHRVIVSFKTTGQSAEPDSYIRQFLDHGHEMQSAFELAGNRALNGVDAKYLWLVTETQPPYATSLLGMSPEMEAFGRERFEAAVSIWAKCLERNYFPGYSRRIAYPDVPAWAWNRWEEAKGPLGLNRRTWPEFLPEGED